MKRLLFIPLLLSLFVVACRPINTGEQAIVTPESTLAESDVPSSTEESSKAGAIAGSPEEATLTFYNWYIEQTKGPDEELRNPIQDGAFREGPNLSPQFVREVEQITASFEGGGYDPVLLAQDIPERVEVEFVADADGRATVLVQRYWDGNPEPVPMWVRLSKAGDQWLIRQVMDTPPAEPGTPQAAAQAFYDWYLDYSGDPKVAHHDNPSFTPELIAQIDRVIAENEAQYGTMDYDPFLCAQNVPLTLTAESILEEDDHAAALVHASFGRHYILVDLERGANGWQLSDIVCTNTAEGVARAFYTWYFGYIGDRDSDEFRNPLVDRAYRESPFLSDSLKAEVDRLVDQPEGAGFDPFLLAQDVPQSFTVEAGPEPASAIVHFTFGETVRDVLVQIDERDYYRIISITEAAGETTPVTDEALLQNPVVVSSDDYGFSFIYPDSWSLQEQAQDGPGMPEAWPVVASWLLMPPDVAQALENATGAPDPDEPEVVAPFQIDVVAGDDQALQRVYPETSGQAMVYGGNQATVVSMEPGYRHVIFAHPTRPDVWIIFTDWVTGFPGREEQANMVQSIWSPLLAGLSFDQ